ncbi:copper amine oxidase N-terminal domain-containing protein [Cohnella suwonensis]|uniref:Copper amine oxidase N-terminal domain-containing protein n=1 Tax=Cohnella suwonensis TaxID=696072 RepID=A0ABW0M346_9BACL
MRKLLSIMLSLSLVLGSVFTFAAVAGAESKFKIQEDAAIAERIKAFNEIKALFTATPDLAAVQAAYIKNFQADVKRIDATIKTGDPLIDEKISFVLDNAIKGTLSAGQAKQAIDKGLQWYFYFAIRDLINNDVRPALTKEDYAAATAAFDKVVQIYEGAIQGTVVKRDASYGIDMVGILKGTIEQLQADLAARNANDFNVHRQVLDKTIMKTFALAVYTYATNMAGKSAADQPAAMTESYFFFLPIYTYLRGGSAEDANFVLNAFGSGDPKKIDPTAIKAAMQRAMIGKVSEYAANALAKLEAGDLPGARGYAMEGNMFLSMQEVFLDKETYAKAYASAQLFTEAVDRSDIKAARGPLFQMLKSMVGIDGTSLTIGSTGYTVDGTAKTALNAPFLNKKTNRTLVPVRLIAAAIHAEIEYTGATKTVTITKDGKKTALVVGSDRITQDGKLNETLIFDQPVVIINGSSFIPLRAVAELFGNGVFYNNNEVIILR